MAKVLNSSKLLSRIPDRPANCKNSLRTANQLRSSRTENDSATNSNICQFVSIRGIRDLCGIGYMYKAVVPLLLICCFIYLPLFVKGSVLVFAVVCIDLFPF